MNSEAAQAIANVSRNTTIATWKSMPLLITLPLALPSCSRRIWSLDGVCWVVASCPRYWRRATTEPLASAAAVVASGAWA